MGLNAKEMKAMDRQVRMGHGSDVRDVLSTIEAQNIPRAQRVELAHLAWRCGIPAWGVKALRPAIRVVGDATDHERLEYGICLLRLGLANEGLEHISSVSTKQHPRALLYRGFAWMARWEYARALPFLRAYLKTVSPRSYEALTARVNLAACLVSLQEDVKANFLLRALLHDSHLRGHRLLLGNVFHLAASFFVRKQEFARALEFIQRGKKFIGDGAPLDALFLDKWKAIADLIQHPTSADAKAAVAAIQQRASELRHWETIRDCDRFLAIHTHDRELARRVYFGTPHEIFRQTLLKQWGDNLLEPRNYVWNLAKGAKKEIRWLIEGDPLKPGQLIYRTLRELTRDFYRPAFPVELYPNLFPGEYYDPESSPHRVHEAIRRLRQTLQEHRVPLTIELEADAYRLDSTSHAIVVPEPSQRKSDELPVVIRLREKFGDSPFSLEGGLKVINLARRSGQRLFKELETEGALRRQGKAKATRYRLVNR